MNDLLEDFMKTTLTFALLLIFVSCASVNETNTEIYTGAQVLENTANTIDRAIATGERVKDRVQERTNKK
jgi:hypothetical protein